MPVSRRVLKDKDLQVIWDDDLKTLRVTSSDGKGEVLIKNNPQGEGVIVVFTLGVEIVRWGVNIGIVSNRRF